MIFIESRSLQRDFGKTRTFLAKFKRCVLIVS